jgi:LacI family transcriptional regulator
VRPDLAERVRGAAQALGYEPDRAASHLRGGKARVIAALVPDLNNPFFTGLLAAVESQLRSEGLNIIVASSNGDDTEEKAHLAALLAWRPAGLVVVPAHDEFACRTLITRTGIPFVVADRVPAHFDGNAVTVDNVDAGRQAAEHLVSLGHSKVVVAASTLKLQNIRERCEGIESVFASGGFPPPTLIEVGLDFDAATERLASFMQGARRPTAFLALTNFATLGVLATLQKWGLRVPQDISVLGFDDYSWMQAFVPPLTAIRQPVAEMGAEIWRKLRTRIRCDDEPSTRVKLRCELIVRASTSPPPAIKRQKEEIGRKRKESRNAV